MAKRDRSGGDRGSSTKAIGEQRGGGREVETLQIALTRARRSEERGRRILVLCQGIRYAVSAPLAMVLLLEVCFGVKMKGLALKWSR
eukprot:695599-Rhodomonas_salina.2